MVKGSDYHYWFQESLHAKEKKGWGGRLQKSTTHLGALNCFKCASFSTMQWPGKMLPPSWVFFTNLLLSFFCKTTIDVFFLKPGANSSSVQLFLQKGCSEMQNLWNLTKCLVSVSYFLLFLSKLWLTCSSCERVHSEVVWVVLVYLKVAFLLLSVFCESTSPPLCVAVLFHTHSLFCCHPNSH